MFWEVKDQIHTTRRDNWLFWEKTAANMSYTLKSFNFICYLGHHGKNHIVPILCLNLWKWSLKAVKMEPFHWGQPHPWFTNLSEPSELPKGLFKMQNHGLQRLWFCGSESHTCALRPHRSPRLTQNCSILVMTLRAVWVPLLVFHVISICFSMRTGIAVNNFHFCTNESCASFPCGHLSLSMK